MADTLVQTSKIRIVTFCFATSAEEKVVTVPKPSKVNVGLSSKKADTSVSCAAVKSVMAASTERSAPNGKFTVMRTLSTGTSNRRASSSLSKAESKGTSMGKFNWPTMACEPTGIGSGVGAVGVGVGGGAGLGTGSGVGGGVGTTLQQIRFSKYNCTEKREKDCTSLVNWERE